MAEIDLWDSAGLVRLLGALREEAGEESAEGEPGPVLAAAVNRAGAGRAVYDEAIDRAVTAALAFRDRHHAEKRESDLLLGVFLDRHWEHAGWPLADALLRASFDKRYSDPEGMRQLARAARRISLQILPKSYPPGVVSDLRARTCAELANAERVLDRFDDTEALLGEARRWQEQGSGEPTLLAYMNEVEASLRLEQRRLTEALGLLEQAHALYQEAGETHLAGRTFVSRARVARTQDNPTAAIRYLEDALPRLDPGRDPALIRAAQQAMLSNLVDSGEYVRASGLLLESGLGEAFADEPLNRLRLRWVEARIHAGMGRLKRAEAILKEIRQEFLARNLAYDAALVGIDLAGVWLRQDQIAPMPALLLEVGATFERLNLRTQDALTAVAFLHEALALNVLSLPVFERTRHFLARYQNDPGLTFDVSGALWG